MGHLFRSAEMTMCQLFLHTNTAYNCISQLGELGCAQFIDTNKSSNALQNKYRHEVKRCDEMEKKLKYLEKEILLDDTEIINTHENPLAPEPREMVEMESNFETLQDDITEINANYDSLKKNFQELVELNYLLQKTKAFFEECIEPQMIQNKIGDTEDPDSTTTEQTNMKFIAGIINRDKVLGFEKMLWRVSRGNVLLKFSDIDVELDDSVMVNKKVSKSVFGIFYQGDQLSVRVNKICDAYHAKIYPCSDKVNERNDMNLNVMTRMDELKIILEQSKAHRHTVLLNVAKHLRTWLVKVRKMKSIYHVLNLFNVSDTDKCLIGDFWCPVNDLDNIKSALIQSTIKDGETAQPVLNILGDNNKKSKPPTFHRVDKFTAAFQNIVDAYGVASYREVNPAPFTVITFPFIFAVMFGDCGHGLIMFLFALALVLREKRYMSEKSDNEIWNMFFGGRYIILLMGLFSVYTGLIYNDAFSKSLNCGSSWYPGVYSESTILSNAAIQLDPAVNSIYPGYPYPFGIDPVWQSSANKITFTNSIKMKMSIILGISQMLFGVALSIFNHKFFNDKLSIFTEFIPQVIFLLAIFGYLIVEIFVKWIMFSAQTSRCAPQLLIGLINMFMFKKYDNATDGCADAPFIPNQFYIQSILVILAVICVPWMLIIKPCVLYCRHKSRVKNLQVTPSRANLLDVGHLNKGASLGDLKKASDGDVDVSKIDLGSVDYSKDDDNEHEEFNMGDIFVHQCIHTIEYCLGCISNTASYLRLWALSLAHAQLSEVLWTMILKIGLGFTNYIGLIVLFFIFAAWASLTIAVLLLMEGLSAFLHALRLHWVEFQNKYYKGEGYKFSPFCFKNVENFKVDI